MNAEPKAPPVSLSLGPVMCDVAGTVLTDAEREVLRHPLVGGVILFSRNYENPAQVAALCAEIHALRTPRLVIAVDHEGGRVQRFRSGFTRLPTMRALGELWLQDEQAACVRAREVGLVLAGELMALGLDLSFTPVLDLDFGTSGVIGDRAFHRDPQIVAELASALTDGLNDAGMGAVGKHFPGHGFVAADSHVAIPVDERDFDTIWADDVQPYRHALGQRLAGIMPAHVIYPQVDARPAGFSPFWLQDVLRGRLGFDGVIFSDDLTMEGATVAGDIVARADAALSAGCDMVLVCNRPDETARLLAGWRPDFPARSAERVESLLPVREGRDFLAGNPDYLAAQRTVADWVAALA